MEEGMELVYSELLRGRSNKGLSKNSKEGNTHAYCTGLKR